MKIPIYIPLYSSYIQSAEPLKRFTLHSLAAVFTPTPTQRIWEEFRHAANTARSSFTHIFPTLPIASCTYLHSRVNWGVVGRTKIPELRNGSKWDPKPNILFWSSNNVSASNIWFCRPPQCASFCACVCMRACACACVRCVYIYSIQFNSVYFQHTSTFHTVTTTCTFCAGKGADRRQCLWTSVP